MRLISCYTPLNMCNNGDILFKSTQLQQLETLAIALKELMEIPEHLYILLVPATVKNWHEALLSREEMVAAEDMGEYYRVPPDLPRPQLWEIRRTGRSANFAN